VVRCPTVSGSRRRRSSVRVTLIAVLLGGVTAGGMAVSSVLSPGGGVLADTADFEPADFVATTTPPNGADPLDGAVSGERGAHGGHRPAATTTAKPTPTTTKPAPKPTTTTKPPPPKPTTTTEDSPPPSQTDEVFTLVNQARADNGCNPLKTDSRLTTAAQGHSDDMAQQNYFSHTTPSGVTFDKREEAAGYPTPGGENIAQGQTSAQQVMTDWMNSSGHRANILNCQFTAIGIGLATNGWYWTQDFGY
jgi:uncharacterized protein YkwD